MIRLYLDQILSTGEEIILDSDATHYLKHVLRLNEGSSLNIFNGIAPFGEYQSTIQSIQKKSITIKIDDFIENDSRSPLNIRLFQGVSKSEKMDLTIQKSVELGVSSIQPVWMERTNVKLNDKKRLEKKCQHWQKVAHSAMEQSGQNALVKVESPLNFDDACQLITDSDLSIVLNPWTDKTLSSIERRTANNINIFIGPEGGLSGKELDLLKKINCLDIKLGPRILRTETASLAIISIIQSLWGDI